MNRARSIYLALLAVLLSPMAANADPISYEYAGVITNCNVAICNLIPVFVGDPVTGTMTIDVDGGGNFTVDNTWMDFSFLVGGVIPLEFPNPDGIFFSGSGIVDVLTGAFLSGTLQGGFVGGTLGGLGGTVDIDLLTGGMTVNVGFGTVFVASVEGGFTVDCVGDPDQYLCDDSTPVPAPGTLALLSLGLLGLGLSRRRRKHM